MKTKIILFLSLPFITLASSWVQPKGGIFLSPSYNYYSANEYYDNNGNKKPMGCTFKESEYQLYGEYGLTNKTTVTFKIPYDYLSCGGNSTSGFGDFETGFIRQIKKGVDYSFSYYGTAIIPTGYSIDKNLRLGYGRFGLEGGGLFGFSGKFGFVDSGIGYRYYFGYPSSQVRSYATAGLNIYKHIQLISTLNLQLGLGNGKQKQVGQNILLEPNYKLAQIYVGPRIVFGNVSFVATYQYVFWGENTGVGKGLNFSLWWNF
ncbi:hypothetical protein [Hydrogenobaculum sp.]|nr:hypothetical protein [Hydrogenobaculum sp.]